MQQKFSEFKCKEVINICDGSRLGYVSDMEFEIPVGRITAIIVPGPCRFLGLFGRTGDYFIPWHCIKRVGDDIILVDVIPNQILLPREKKGILF